MHRLDDLIVPRFFWLLFMLHASLYSMYGVPVSVCDSRMWNHSSCATPMPFEPTMQFNAICTHQRRLICAVRTCALTVLRARPACSYFVYSASNSAP